MEFQQVLLKVQDSLSEDEVLDLVFLCSELISKDLSNVGTARDLFTLLQNEDRLSSDNPSLLIELLRIIKRNNLIRDLQQGTYPLQQAVQISSYRQLLYELAEDISEEDLKNIKFLLAKTIPRRKLLKNLTMLQLFLEMEKEGVLDESNLETIERVIGTINPRLQKKIQQFKMDSGAGITAQETNRSSKDDSQDTSITKGGVQPESTVQNEETSAKVFQGLDPNSELIPPSFFSPTTERPRSLSSLPVDVVEGRIASLSLNRSSSLLNQVQTFHGEFTSAPNEKDLNSPNTEQSKPLQLRQYEMKGNYRGFCLIINNYKFWPCANLKDREGTDVDKQSLDAVFSWLGFKVETVKDCTKDQILQALEKLRSYNHTEADCVVCCVLTHGYEGGVFGVDGKKVTREEMREPLSGLHCPSLNEKPKLYFIQACQGTKEQRPVFVQTDGPNDSSGMESDVCSDASVPKQSIPEWSDFLMAMATVPHHASFRHKLEGTWFIQSLCQNLLQLVPKGFDLLSILTQVNNDVSRKTDQTGKRKQIPQPEYTLTKRLVFPVPQTPPPSLNIKQ